MVNSTRRMHIVNRKTFRPIHFFVLEPGNWVLYVNSVQAEITLTKNKEWPINKEIFTICQIKQ